MNERIRLLAEQAGGGPSKWYTDPDVLEKFAESIVQECIDIISPYTVRMSRPGEEFLHPISEIKNCFGVK